jgi:hydrogenase maturation factor
MSTAGMKGIDSTGIAVAAVGATCSAEPGCITCGDVAVVLTVDAVDGSDAQCRDEQGRTELVATELVGRVQPGDQLLVHAGVAIERVNQQRGE